VIFIGRLRGEGSIEDEFCWRGLALLCFSCGMKFVVFASDVGWEVSLLHLTANVLPENSYAVCFNEQVKCLVNPISKLEDDHVS